MEGGELLLSASGNSLESPATSKPKRAGVIAKRNVDVIVGKSVSHRIVPDVAGARI